MKKVLILFSVVMILVQPVSALELTAPTAPPAAADVMPDEPQSFGEGLWELCIAIIATVRPEITEAAGVCLSVMAAGLLISLLQPMTGRGKRFAELTCTVSVALILMTPTKVFVKLGIQTVEEMIRYGKLLLPVMTAGLAAQGGITKSAALYTGTAAFNTVLGDLIVSMVVPVVSAYLALAVADSAIGDVTLKKIRDLLKWCAAWVLKIGLYIFTGYMSLTGVITGSADAAALKVTKSTISMAVPVIGNILSEASETVLVGAAVVKNAAGVYGMLVILAIFLGPFVRIGIQYLMLKCTATICSVFTTKQTTELIGDFSSAMGLLLAVTGTVCLMLLISTVCFMKGVS